MEPKLEAIEEVEKRKTFRLQLKQVKWET